MVAQRLLREDLVIRVPHKESKGERLCNSYCYRFTARKNISQNYELINSLEFFFFILMNYIVKDYNAFCTAFISLKLLLSKILLFSHFVGEPNYWSVEFHPRNSNSWTFLNLHILLFLLLYLYLILKDCVCFCHCKQSVPSHCVT